MVQVAKHGTLPVKSAVLPPTPPGTTRVLGFSRDVGRAQGEAGRGAPLHEEGVEGHDVEQLVPRVTGHVEAQRRLHGTAWGFRFQPPPPNPLLLPVTAGVKVVV